MMKIVSGATKVAIATLLAYTAANAESIVKYEESDLGGGFWLYNYSVLNPFSPITNPGVNLYDVEFQFPELAFVLSLPGGWDQASVGTFIDTFSTNPGVPPLGTDVAPMDSLSGFLFLFDSRIGDVPFAARFSNPDDPSLPVLVTGVTVSAVPEPSTGVMTFVVVLFVCATNIKNRKALRILKRLSCSYSRARVPSD